MKNLKIVNNGKEVDTSEWTRQDWLDIGVSSPEAPEYSLIGECDTGEPETDIVSLDAMIEAGTYE